MDVPNIAPIDVAISIALYCAERAKGPFQNHFISFSSRPQLIETTGVDFCDKVYQIYRRNLCENTNISATFDLILNIAKKRHLHQDELPQNLIIISDMQFDAASYGYKNTLMEDIEEKWHKNGYAMPHLIFWNVNAASGGGNIPMLDKDGITYVSGASPAIFTSILTGETGYQLMIRTITNKRYAPITSIR